MGERAGRKAAGSGLQTEYKFTLPRGYVDSSGTLHREGTMRLATAIDEIGSLRDMRVRGNQAYLTLIILAQVVTRLGTLPDINTGVMEGLFAADLAFLQDLYQRINDPGAAKAMVACPNCAHRFEAELIPTGES